MRNKMSENGVRWFAYGKPLFPQMRALMTITVEYYDGVEF